MPFKCLGCTKRFDSQTKCKQHMNDTGHAIPQHECISCRRVCLSREALQQHQRDTGHLKVDETPQIGAADIISIQETAVAESSGTMATVKPEKPHDEPETCNPVDLNGDVATLHMQFLGHAPSQEQNEIDSSPLLLVPTLQRSPSLQFGLLGGILSEDGRPSEESRIFYNVSCPSSIFICGSQGSGKSNTLACLLENCLIPSELGKLSHPLAGIVFHYDTFASDDGGLPCEAAFLASHAKASVRVLCAPTSFRTVKKVYSGIPQVDVKPLNISSSDLNTSRMLGLMAFQEGSKPLYLQVVQRILRDIRLEQQEKGSQFDYAKFKTALAREKFSEGQQGPLQQRLETLESFMVKGKARSDEEGGQLTIVDLSCPCITPEMACLLFNICLSLFLEQKSVVGRVVALDEAHKYLGQSGESQVLTNSLLQTVRIQRHLGVRMFISTQEPTISPKLLDLCTMTIVHRFTSPDWLRTLRRHLANKDDILEEGANTATSGQTSVVVGLFQRIMALRTGQGLVFAPSALIRGSQDTGHDGLCRNANESTAIQVRSRLTRDGGRTVMAGQTA
ncbi:hypothetical protein CGGC5_v015985 [Colletotrichum fructicola Nara gc5]|uniref:C2H2-type domain-containing protein n=2 Tax=Colletotrichum fructicola (strain Nara gc5) TaxID=1213859 RepID=A0A7J6III4_COLFN|nr:hypothetical protein CGGC5_v015985 [Colletotrichum fructicola Nara gc5]KAF4881777.1 hypothetical protein CGCFRS4_v015216 [Colletotrichum fructicola]